MPVVLFINGFRFKFYGNENYEPPHVHITKGNGNAKYWLVPELDEAYSYGFTVRERREIRELVTTHRELLIRNWYDYFGT